MRLKLPLRLSSQQFVLPLLLQTALLLVVALGAGPATAADDCSSAYDHTYCLRESLSTAGSVRTLTVTPLRQQPATDFFNVIVPGQPQAKVAAGKFIWIPVPANGQVVYSVQDCIDGTAGVTRSFCDPWTRIVRSFAPVATCQSYANAASAAVSEAASAGCGYTGARWDSNQQNHLNACLNFQGDWQSFVNNETNGRANDLTACKSKTAAASKPIKTTGAGSQSSLPADNVLICTGGGMTVTPESGTAGAVFVNFVAAAQGANVVQPPAGQCAWSTGPIGSVWKKLGVATSQSNGQQLLQAAQNGGSFVVEARTLGAGIVYVDRIDSVQPAPRGSTAAKGNAGSPPAGSGYVLVCQGGGAMRISGGGAVLNGPSFFSVTFGAASQAGNSGRLDPGTCAWIDRPLNGAEPLQLNIPNNLDGADSLRQALRHGSFQVHANNEGHDLLVNRIDGVHGGGVSNGGGNGISVGIGINVGGGNAQGGISVGNGTGNGDSVLRPPIAEGSGSESLTIAKAANVHTTAGGGSVLGSLAAGTAVTSLGCSKGWCHIQFAGGEGYVAESFTTPN